MLNTLGESTFVFNFNKILKGVTKKISYHNEKDNYTSQAYINLLNISKDLSIKPIIGVDHLRRTYNDNDIIKTKELLNSNLYHKFKIANHFENFIINNKKDKDILEIYIKKIDEIYTKNDREKYIELAIKLLSSYKLSKDNKLNPIEINMLKTIFRYINKILSTREVKDEYKSLIKKLNDIPDDIIQQIFQ